jgi:hypothetical protein
MTKKNRLTLALASVACIAAVAQPKSVLAEEQGTPCSPAPDYHIYILNPSQGECADLGDQNFCTMMKNYYHCSGDVHPYGESPTCGTLNGREFVLCYYD